VTKKAVEQLQQVYRQLRQSVDDRFASAGEEFVQRTEFQKLKNDIQIHKKAVQWQISVEFNLMQQMQSELTLLAANVRKEKSRWPEMVSLLDNMRNDFSNETKLLMQTTTQSGQEMAERVATLEIAMSSVETWSHVRDLRTKVEASIRRQEHKMQCLKTELAFDMDQEGEKTNELCNYNHRILAERMGKHEAAHHALLDRHQALVQQLLRTGAFAFFSSA
jgi:hypothetical protein